LLAIQGRNRLQAGSYIDHPMVLRFETESRVQWIDSAQVRSVVGAARLRHYRDRLTLSADWSDELLRNRGPVPVIPGEAIGQESRGD